MYLSHPVRRMREDPIEGEEVVLIVTSTSEDEAALDSLELALDAVGGTVEKRLQFGSIRVRVPQELLDDLCELDGIDSIKTENAVGYDGDAGEDFDLQ